jgi:hypothetical protein
VEAFSLSKALHQRASARAAEKGMTKSGYYRYALARELGYSETEAQQISRHGAIDRLANAFKNQPGMKNNPAVSAGAINLAEDPGLPPAVKAAADKLEALAAKQVRKGRKKTKE